jgi:hypothetical protein
MIQWSYFDTLDFARLMVAVSFVSGVHGAALAQETPALPTHEGDFAVRDFKFHCRISADDQSRVLWRS